MAWSDVLIRCGAVAAGGALGSLARYGLSVCGASLGTRLPYATLIANAVGCLAMGVLMHAVLHRGWMSEGWRLFLAVGLLGGLTTFSTFSHEALALARDGQTSQAAAYVVVSVAVGLGGAGLGWWLASLVPVGSLS